MIAVIDYGLGNLASVKNALDKLGIPNLTSADAKIIQSAKAIVLPGVGAAGAGMKNLAERSLDTLIKEEVKSGKPLLGICLGMQLLFSYSEEDHVNCLKLIEGKVKKFDDTLKVPQIGWNQVETETSSKLFKDIKNNSYFYFVNSYFCQPEEKNAIKGSTDYGVKFCSVSERDNVYGVQFHPEKSGDSGLQILKNFWEAS